MLTKILGGISTDFSGLLFRLDVSLTFGTEDKGTDETVQTKHVDTPVKVRFRGKRCCLFMFVPMEVLVLF